MIGHNEAKAGGRLMHKNSSPIIVRVETRKLHELHSGNRHTFLDDYGDVTMLMGTCFLLFGLFVYYWAPLDLSRQYAKTSAELAYHWQVVWYMFEYDWYTSYLPYLQSLLQSLLALWPY